ncbi:MAG TPA: twin-arginine translocation signal domain-containing protein, partial [Polyangiaceae bacterium]
MDRREFLTAAGALVATGTVLGAPGAAYAEEATVLRIGTLAPNGSSWMRVFNAWNNTLTQKTGGKLKLHFFA